MLHNWAWFQLKLNEIQAIGNPNENDENDIPSIFSLAISSHLS